LATSIGLLARHGQDRQLPAESRSSGSRARSSPRSGFGHDVDQSSPDRLVEPPPRRREPESLQILGICKNNALREGRRRSSPVHLHAAAEPFCRCDRQRSPRHNRRRGSPTDPIRRLEVAPHHRGGDVHHSPAKMSWLLVGRLVQHSSNRLHSANYKLSRSHRGRGQITTHLLSRHHSPSGVRIVITEGFSSGGRIECSSSVDFRFRVRRLNRYKSARNGRYNHAPPSRFYFARSLPFYSCAR